MHFRALCAGFSAALFAACLSPAWADVGGFLGNWVNSSAHPSGFLSSLVGSPSDVSGIARIVVTPAGASHVRIHVFGRCESGLCDWGTQMARNHSGSPGSDEVRSLYAEFNTGFAQEKLTLRQGPGGSLRFDLVTDFTDGSGHHDYQSNGLLTAAPGEVPIASAAAPGTPIVAAPASLPALTGGLSNLGGAPAEDCVAINNANVYVAPSDRGWKLSDYNHTILNFGSNKAAALKAQIVLDFYHIDEQCYVARPHPRMIYWRSAGQLPHGPLANQDCIDVHPAAVRVEQKDGSWKVIDGSNVLLDYGEEQTGAQLAVSVIQTYRPTRQCFVARPDTTMSYWLTQ